ncbi:MAG: anhydro-N-acetylmuramic acid kinase [Mariprofundus sp.]
MKSPHLCIGIMSGTSADGIDVAIVSFADKPSLVHFTESPMPPQLRKSILRLTSPGFGEIDNMGALDRQLGQAYADAVLLSMQSAGLKACDIEAIGCHGQTIRHRPDAAHPFTLQIGCAATIAEYTGITTVSDFRSRDIAAGGQGAPLVPFAHRQLFGSANEHIAALNIGGIANITWLGADGYTTGFDTGPGNMIMDGLMLTISDGKHRYDQNGTLAASGSVCDTLLNTLMQHPYLKRTPPKSTGREEFGEAIINSILAWPDLTDADRLATACRFSVESIAASRRFLPGTPQQWLICGGGVRNSHLMQELNRALAPAKVMPTDAAGMPAQAVESASFAILARQTLRGECNTIAHVTGADHHVCGGQITPGNNWAQLLQAIPQWTR